MNYRQVLHPYSLKLLCLSPAQFIHFGTTHELLKLVTEDIDNYEFLDWKRQVLGVEESEGANACSNSYIEKHTEIAESSYIEDSYIYDGSEVGERLRDLGSHPAGRADPGGHGAPRPEAEGRPFRGARLRRAG